MRFVKTPKSPHSCNAVRGVHRHDRKCQSLEMLVFMFRSSNCRKMLKWTACSACPLTSPSATPINSSPSYSRIVARPSLQVTDPSIVKIVDDWYHVHASISHLPLWSSHAQAANPIAFNTITTRINLFIFPDHRLLRKWQFYTYTSFCASY